MVKISCEVCGIEGTLQQLTPRHFRIKHYLGIDQTTKKPKCSYHQISKEYAEKSLKEKGVKIRSKKLRIDQTFDLNNNYIDLNKLKISFILNNEAGPLGFEPRAFSLEG
jgi:hypothetical protein